MKSHTLTFENLVIARDDTPLSAPISLTLNAGEMLAIHGANGSGKSTLLKMVAGLLPVGVGRISPRDDIALYLAHQRGLTPSLSVYDNVAFWARATGHPELTAAAMRYFNLDDIPDVRVDTLSAGWQQRVALTRLVTQPSGLWLLDEPTANLDAEGVSLLQSLMHARLEQGGIILVATHFQLQGKKIKVLQLSGLERKSNV